MYDLLIIGSGPSGLAAALSAKQRGLDFLVLERGAIAQTIRDYPLHKQLFSTSNEVELERGVLPVETKPTREEVLAHYNNLVDKEHLNIRTQEEVESITPSEDAFTVKTKSNEYRTRAVLVAVGGFGRKRMLQVPGENDSRVAYRFIEAAPFASKKILVIGGGNSAAQAALFLTEEGAHPMLSFRRESLEFAPDPITGKPVAKIKPWVMAPMNQMVSEGCIQLLPNSQIIEILPHSAVLHRLDSGESLEVECDHIFALIGADPDTTLLETAGAEIASDGRPLYNIETYETTVAGLYVAGHMTRELHMKNALEVTPRIVDHIASRLLQPVG